MNQPPPIPDHIKSFVDHVTWIRGLARIVDELFQNPAAQDIMERTAPRFLKVMNHVTINSAIGAMCRITEPAKTFGQQNLTARSIVEETRWTDGRAQEAEQIAERCDCLHQRLKERRNKLLAHNDLDAILTDRRFPLPADIAKKVIEQLELLIKLVFAQYGRAWSPVVLGGRGDVVSFRKALGDSLLYERALDDERLSKDLKTDMLLWRLDISEVLESRKPHIPSVAGAITRIVIKNFKSLKHVELIPGTMNLLIGTNASGKSNFLEALRILQGVANGFTISEILDGKPPGATSEVWDGIRGGRSQTSFAGSDTTGDVSVEVHGTLRGDGSLAWEFLIAFSPTTGQVTREHLRIGQGQYIYNSDAVEHWYTPGESTIDVRYYPGSRKNGPLTLRFENSRPVLGQLAAKSVCRIEHLHLTEGVAALLANMQHVDPSPSVLRGYSTAPHVLRMGDRGENFAALVNTICQDQKMKDAYLSWLRELRPEQVDNVGTLSGSIGEPMFMLSENGKQFPAPVLSAGTLRFAATVAAFFQPEMPAIMTIEEIENGIHASRLRTLVELLRSQSKHAKTQVFASTHSPTTLEWLHESEYRTTFLCSRDDSTGESTIRPLSEVPHFVEVVKKAPLSDLLAEGWLEMAL